MRNQYWDACKGLAVIAVVAIHACGSALLFPDESANHLFAVILRQFINFPVALFVFLSGMFAGQSASSLPYFSSVRSRVVRLLVPYLFWAAVYCGAKAITGKLLLADLPEMLLTGTVVSVGYYVIVMVQISILSPLLERCSSTVLKVAFPVSIAASCAFTYGMRVDSGIWTQFPYSALPFFLWLPFYLAGLIAGKASPVSGEGSRWGVWLVLAMLGAAASVLEALHWMPSAAGLAISQLKITSMMTSLCICGLMMSLARSWVGMTGWRKALAWGGARSFYFYLSHMLVLGVVQSVLFKIPALVIIQPIFIGLAVSITICICAVGAVVFQVAVRGSRPALRWVGMG